MRDVAIVQRKARERCCGSTTRSAPRAVRQSLRAQSGVTQTRQRIGKQRERLYDDWRGGGPSSRLRPRRLRFGCARGTRRGPNEPIPAPSAYGSTSRALRRGRPRFRAIRYGPYGPQNTDYPQARYEFRREDGREGPTSGSGAWNVDDKWPPHRGAAPIFACRTGPRSRFLVKGSDAIFIGRKRRREAGRGANFQQSGRSSFAPPEFSAEPRRPLSRARAADRYSPVLKLTSVVVRWKKTLSPCFLIVTCFTVPPGTASVHQSLLIEVSSATLIVDSTH